MAVVSGVNDEVADGNQVYTVSISVSSDDENYGSDFNSIGYFVNEDDDPTGLVVLCRAERSQHKNREKAMKMLRAKLYQLELDKRLEAQAEINAKKRKIDFGSQIRSYVMQPYQQVKDNRTEQVTGDVQGMLDGHVLPFMEAWLAARADGTLSQ